MSALQLLNIADMKRGELMSQIDNAIQKCAKDISERENVTGKRAVTVNITLEEKSGMIQIMLDTQVKTPKSPSVMTMGYIKNGKLVASGDVEDVMHQPKLETVEKKPGKVSALKTGTDGK